MYYSPYCGKSTPLVLLLPERRENLKPALSRRNKLVLLMAIKQNRYAYLDGIRGVAAIFILTRHTFNYWYFSFPHSYLAVDLFYIISGFVIAYAYDHRIVCGSISARRFMLIRLIRLYPVFLLSVLVSIATLIYTKISTHTTGTIDLLDTVWTILTAILFLPYHSTTLEQTLFPLNGVYWSLFFELVANMLYAVVRPFLNDRQLLYIVIICGLSISWCTYIYGNTDVGFLWEWVDIGFGFLRSIFGIFLGLLLYRNSAYFSKYFNRQSSWIVFPIIGIVLSLPEVENFDGIVDIIAIFLIFPMCIISATQAVTIKREKILLLFGAASYPIYVLHLPVSIILLHALKGIDTYAPLSGIVFTLFLIAMSVWIEKKYDIPLRRRLSALLANRIL